MKEIGLYVHIPFCKQKCKYCDFTSFAGKENLIEEYIKWLCVEIKQVGEGIKLDVENKRSEEVLVKTIYIGGGTPSSLAHIGSIRCSANTIHLAPIFGVSNSCSIKRRASAT